MDAMVVCHPGSRLMLSARGSRFLISLMDKGNVALEYPVRHVLQSRKGYLREKKKRVQSW